MNRQELKNMIIEVMKLSTDVSDIEQRIAAIKKKLDTAYNRLDDELDKENGNGPNPTN